MPDTAARPGLDKRKSIILSLVELLVLAIIFLRVMPQIGSYADAATALKQMTVGALVLIGISVLVYLAWYGLPFVAAVPELRYGRAQQLNQSAFAISNGIPAGGTFGLGVQYAMLSSYAVTPTAGTAAIAAVGVWSVFVTLGLPIVGVAAVAISGQAAGSYVRVAIIGLTILVVGISVFVLIMRSERTARSIGRRGNKLFGGLIHRFAKGKRVDLVEVVVTLRTDIVGLVTRRWAAITVTQVGVSITQFFILYFALRGVQGWNEPGTAFLLVFGAFAISQIGIMIPITPGGLGTVDAALVALLTSFGVSPGDATAADLVWRGASFVPQIIIGIVCLVTWTRKTNRRIVSAPNPEGASDSGPIPA